MAITVQCHHQRDPCCWSLEYVHHHDAGQHRPPRRNTWVETSSSPLLCLNVFISFVSHSIFILYAGLSHIYTPSPYWSGRHSHSSNELGERFLMNGEKDLIHSTDIAVRLKQRPPWGPICVEIKSTLFAAALSVTPYIIPWASGHVALAHVSAFFHHLQASYSILH